MKSKGSPSLPPGLNQLRERFDRWRETKHSRDRIPEKLWKAAAKLCRGAYAVQRISKALRLNYTALKERVETTAESGRSGTTPRPTFVEMDLHPPAPAAECLVELEDRRGGKLKFSLRGHGGLDLVALADAFWRRGS